MESTAQINKRVDFEQWHRRIKPMMQDGALLRYEPKTGQYYTDHKGYFGQYGIGKTAVRYLEKDGEIVLVGVQTYGIAML